MHRRAGRDIPEVRGGVAGNTVTTTGHGIIGTGRPLGSGQRKGPRGYTTQRLGEVGEFHEEGKEGHEVGNPNGPGRPGNVPGQGARRPSPIKGHPGVGPRPSYRNPGLTMAMLGASG